MSKSELNPGAAADYDGAEAGRDHALEQRDGQTMTPVPAGPARIIWLECKEQSPTGLHQYFPQRLKSAKN